MRIPSWTGAGARVDPLRRRPSGRELAFVAGYFPLYFTYLFLYQEGELVHWLSLVLLPLTAVALMGRYDSLRSLLRSIGLDPQHATRGLVVTLLLGAGFQGIQLLNARQRTDLFAGLAEPWGFLAPAAAFVILLGTAATTEEVFFRGIMQRRLASYYGSDLAALLLTTLAFILYHLPYAYANPAWPSAGNLAAAVRLATVNGLLGGLVLGTVFWRSRNLVAAICLHALINLIPATRFVTDLMEPR